MIELVGSLLLAGWGLAAGAGRPWWWRWWARPPSIAEGRAVVVIGVGAATWSIGEGMALVGGTVVQLTGLAVVLVGGGVLARATAQADGGGDGDTGTPDAPPAGRT